jgi:hypothetical protein
MGMHWLEYDIWIVGKVEMNTFVVTVLVNYLAYAETNTPRYRVFRAVTRQTYSATTLATGSQML